MSIFDGLPDPSAPAQAFFNGLAHGKAQEEDKQVRGALTAYALDPTDPQAFQTLAYYRPDMAIQIGQDRAKQQQAAQLADLQRRAASGDKAAQAELWGIAPDTANKIGDNQRADLSNRVNAIGQAALRISQLPPEQRPQAWDSAVGELSKDYPELAQYQGKYSEAALSSAIDSAKLVTEHFNLTRPHYQAVPEGGSLVNTDSPAAVAEYMKGMGPASAAPVQVRSIEEAHSLAPGTQFIDPNGVHRVVPGGAGGNVSGGFPNIERYYSQQ